MSVSTPNEETKFLARQPWYSHLTAREQSRLTHSAFTISAPAAGTLLRGGDPCGGWYGVMSGLAKKQSRREPGNPAVLSVLQPGEWFGESLALHGERLSYEVIAVRETTLLCIPQVLFDDLVQESPQFNRALLGYMSQKLQQGRSTIESGASMSDEQRVAAALNPVLWSGRRNGVLSPFEICVLTGLSFATTLGVLAALESDNLLRVDGERVEVIDEKGLALCSRQATMTE